MAYDPRTTDPDVLREYLLYTIKRDIDELARLGAYEELWNTFDHVLYKMPKTEKIEAEVINV